MYKISFFTPPEHAPGIKAAMFAAGAGRLGNYDSCSWETLGTGQFRPRAGARPNVGEVDRVERLAELKVEMLCRREVLPAALAALKKAHPYEEVALEVISLVDPQSLQGLT